jgi:uncharacterized protein YjdB
MKRFTAVPTFLVALVACQEPTKSVTADSETSTPLSVRTTAGTFTISVRSTSGATGPSLAVFGSGNDTHCAGTAPSGTYMGNVVVNPNAVCNLSGSTITGNLIARENATLIAEHNDIRGNVELLQTGLVSIGVSVIGGSILSDKPKRGLDIYRSQIGGSILAKEGTAFIGLCGNTLKNGPIVVEKNKNSSILVGGDGCVDFGGGNILENVDLKVVENEVVPVSGVPSNGLQIGDNQIGQHLQVFKNRGGLPKAVTRNTVGASLQCFENTAPFIGEPNVAQEAEGQCRASAPAAVPVASVTVTPSTATVEPGKTVQLAATTRDANGTVLTGRTVTWASSNTAVATVSSSGLVTGKAASAEPASITATSEGKIGTAQITVPPVASVTVAPSTASVEAGKTVQLTATTRDANGNVLTGRTVAWTSLNTAVATVSSSGLVTGVAAGGPAGVEATSEGQTGTAQITVTAPPPPPPPVASVAVAPSTATVEPGKTVQLTATTLDANGNVLTGRTVTWTSLNTAVATVSSSGLVTGVAEGSAGIEATSEGKTGTAQITVPAPPPPPPPAPVFSVTVTPSTATVQPGQTVQLAATTRAEDGTVLTGRTVTWASSNTAVATVSSSGLVTGVAPSSEPASITATSEGKTGTAQITVPPVASVTVAPSTATVEIGKTVQLAATTRDASGNVLTGRTVAWRSLNTAVATVSSSGLVTGVAAGGPVSIEAASEGKTGTAEITVPPLPPPPPPSTNSPTCAQYAEPRIWLESQGWWDSRGLVIPSRVGEHIHVGTCWPVTPDGGDATVTGTVHFDVRVTLHDETGKTDILRVAQESVIRQIVPLVMGPAADATVWVPFDVNTDGWDTGRREWRWTANVPRNSEGNRQFQSTGWQLCVRACTPNETYRAGPWTEGRGWYDDGHGYQNARFLSKLPYAPLSGLWTFRVRLVQRGVGGVFIDPDFHAGNQGIKIASGGYDGNLTIDTRTLSNGVHRLVLVASDNQSAGVQVIEFRVAN